MPCNILLDFSTTCGHYQTVTTHMASCPNFHPHPHPQKPTSCKSPQTSNSYTLLPCHFCTPASNRYIALRAGMDITQSAPTRKALIDEYHHVRIHEADRARFMLMIRQTHGHKLMPTYAQEIAQVQAQVQEKYNLRVDTEGGMPTCGICKQVLWREREGRRVLCGGGGGECVGCFVCLGRWVESLKPSEDGDEKREEPKEVQVGKCPCCGREMNVKVIGFRDGDGVMQEGEGKGEGEREREVEGDEGLREERKTRKHNKSVSREGWMHIDI